MSRDLDAFKVELFEWLAAAKTSCGEYRTSRSAKAISDFCAATEAHFGLKPGAKTTIIRDE